MDGLADLLLLIMVGVIAFFTTQNYRARETGMAEFTVGSFASWNWVETRLLQVSDQLAYFTGHEIMARGCNEGKFAMDGNRGLKKSRPPYLKARRALVVRAPLAPLPPAAR